MVMKVVIGSDHAGYRLKESVKNFLIGKGMDVEDVGTHSEESTDYPLYAEKVARYIQDGKAERGILICGTGIGMSISANKFRGIRASLCTNEYMARMSRRHNNANILCLGSRVVGEDLALSIVSAWLDEEFEGGRHLKRLTIIEEWEGGKKGC